VNGAGSSKGRANSGSSRFHQKPLLPPCRSRARTGLTLRKRRLQRAIAVMAVCPMRPKRLQLSPKLLPHSKRLSPNPQHRLTEQRTRKMRRARADSKTTLTRWTGRWTDCFWILAGALRPRPAAWSLLPQQRKDDSARTSLLPIASPPASVHLIFCDLSLPHSLSYLSPCRPLSPHHGALASSTLFLLVYFSGAPRHSFATPHRAEPRARRRPRPGASAPPASASASASSAPTVKSSRLRTPSRELKGSSFSRSGPRPPLAGARRRLGARGLARVGLASGVAGAAFAPGLAVRSRRRPSMCTMTSPCAGDGEAEAGSLAVRARGSARRRDAEAASLVAEAAASDAKARVRVGGESGGDKSPAAASRDLGAGSGDDGGPTLRRDRGGSAVRILSIAT
jgi:hypothetical protein